MEHLENENSTIFELRILYDGDDCNVQCHIILFSVESFVMIILNFAAIFTLNILHQSHMHIKQFLP